MILSQLVLITVSKDTICAVSGLTQKIIFPDEFDKNIVLWCQQRYVGLIWHTVVEISSWYFVELLLLYKISRTYFHYCMFNKFQTFQKV